MESARESTPAEIPIARHGTPPYEIAIACRNGAGEQAGILLEDSLRSSSLVVERVEGGNKELFLKIGATVEVLGLAAESLKLRKATILGVEAVFKWEDEHMFNRQLNGELFTWTERYRCLDSIIRKTTSCNNTTVKVLIPLLQREIEIEPDVTLVPLLEKNGFIKECFPLHVEFMRRKLLRQWALNWFSFLQPLDDINAYFGPKVAIYFAFLGMYTKWLGFLACIGLIFYFCDWGDYTVAIPPIFGTLVVLWGMLFLQFWKRRSVELTERWEIVQGDDEVGEQKSRWEKALEKQKKELASLEVIAKGKEAVVLSEQPALEELHEEEWRGCLLSLGSNTAALLGVVVLQLPLEASYHYLLHFFAHKVFYQYALTVVYVAAVGQLTAVGGKLGMWLNSRETFVSGEAAQDALVTKVFATYFLQSFYGLAYTALVHRDFAAVRNFLLRRLLVSQILDNMTESLLPYIKYRYNRFQSFRAECDAKKERGEKEKAPHVTSDVERQYLMPPYVASVGGGRYDGVFDDFLELALQFGLVTMFACCFPLVGVFSLLNNIVEIHSDSFKLLSMLRRPVPHKVASIGSWLTIFQQLGVMAIVSNCLLVVYMYGEGSWHMDPALLLVLCSEHLLLLARHGIVWFVPEEPAWVKVKRRKRAKVRDHFSAEVLRAFGSKREMSL